MKKEGIKQIEKGSRQRKEGKKERKKDTKEQVCQGRVFRVPYS
jgi:hypothetical protein